MAKRRLSEKGALRLIKKHLARGAGSTSYTASGATREKKKSYRAANKPTIEHNENRIKVKVRDVGS